MHRLYNLLLTFSFPVTQSNLNDSLLRCFFSDVHVNCINIVSVNCKQQQYCVTQYSHFTLNIVHSKLNMLIL